METKREPYRPMPPMLWHKFLVFVYLPVFGVINLIDSVLLIPKVLKSRAMATMPLVMIVMLLCALFVIGMSLFAFVLRRRLDDGRQNAPMQLFWFFLLNCVPRLITLLLTGVLSRAFDGSLSLSALIALAVSLAMAILNLIYYKKRAWLFDC